MPRGYPDFGVEEALGETLLPTDIAELAARLGSIHTWDRRGKVILLDNFESPLLKWGISNIGTATSVLDSTTARSGAQCLKFSVGALVTAISSMSRSVSVQRNERLGLEWAFAPQHTNMYQELRIWYESGTFRKIARILIYSDTGAIWYYDDGGVAVLLATLGELKRSALMFHTAKLVVDFENNKYVRFVLNSIETDMSTLAIQTTGLVSAPTVGIVLYERLDAAGLKVCYVDDWIVTRDEP